MATQIITKQVDNEITADTPFATPRIRDIIARASTLDEVDFNDPGILADIRAAYAVLAQIKVEDER